VQVEKTNRVAAQLVHIHGEIFVTRCTNCDFATPDRDTTSVPDVPRCPLCHGLLRPGIVWFDEELNPRHESRIRGFLAKGECDAVLLIGTTATFDYIREWALSGRGRNGQLVEINPNETNLSPKADQIFRERAALALPRLIKAATGVEA
jgi:NAD-dependent deacetylase